MQLSGCTQIWQKGHGRKILTAPKMGAKCALSGHFLTSFKVALIVNLFVLPGTLEAVLSRKASHERIYTDKIVLYTGFKVSVR